MINVVRCKFVYASAGDMKLPECKHECNREGATELCPHPRTHDLICTDKSYTRPVTHDFNTRDALAKLSTMKRSRHQNTDCRLKYIPHRRSTK